MQTSIETSTSAALPNGRCDVFEPRSRTVSGTVEASCIQTRQSTYEEPERRDVSSRFGRRLRDLRRERNLTQIRMASEFGIDRSFISDVERGRKSLSLPMLEVIALGMKISLSELLHGL